MSDMYKKTKNKQRQSHNKQEREKNAKSLVNDVILIVFIELKRFNSLLETSENSTNLTLFS